MSDLETLLNELPTLIDESKITIGNSSKIKRELSRLNDVQQKLVIIYNELNSANEFEKNKNMAMGMLKFIAPIAGIFIPGGFLIDLLVGRALEAAAYKFGETDTQLTLEDLVERIPHFVGWSETLREIAKDLLNNYVFFTVLDTERKHPILTEQFRQISEKLNIHLEFGDEPTLKEQLQQIKAAQKDLKQIQIKIDTILKNSAILQNYEDREDITEIIKLLLMFFGKTVFAIEWIDDEGRLIISFEDQVFHLIAVENVIGECTSIKEKSNALVLQSNSLRGQAEQSIKQLEEERRRQEEQEKLRQAEEENRRQIEEKKHRETAQIRIQNEQIKPLVKPIRFPIKALLAASTVAALGYAGWTSGIATPQIQQLLNNLQLSQNTDELKPNYQLQTSANLETTQKPNPEQETSVNLEAIQKPNPEQEAATNLETAQKLAMEAAVMTQNSPHPLEIWQKSQAKWQEAVNVLEAIPENLAISAKAKEKLANYRINFTAISNRIITEKKASTNLETAQKLAMEASVMMQNSSQSAEIWQQAKAKLQEAISLLEAIPNNTFVSAQVKNNLLIYRTNYAVVSQK